MYYIEPVLPRVYLIHRSGDRYMYEDKITAARALCNVYSPTLGWEFYKEIGDNFRVHKSDVDKSIYDVSFLEDINDKVFDYILRDSENNVIKVSELRAMMLAEHRANRRWHRRLPLDYDHDRDFRKRPVSGTGGGSWSRYYRHPKTTQEKRNVSYDAVDEDVDYHNVKIRTRRNSTNLPQLRDDRKRYNQKSWKNQRQTQWKQ